MLDQRAVFRAASLVVLLGAGFAQNNHSDQPQQTKFDSTQEAIVVEERATSVRFEDNGASKKTVRARIRIQNEAGLRQYGVLVFPFQGGQDLSIDAVEVHKKDGAIVRAGAENIQEVTPDISRSAPTYSDLREKDVTVPGLSVGDELVYQYTIKSKPVVPHQFWFQYSFYRKTIVHKESVEVDVPRGRVLHVAGQEKYKPEIETRNDRTIYRWRSARESLPDPATQRFVDRREEATGNAPLPSIALSSFESWDDVGAWYYALQRERATPTPAIRAKALALTKNATTPEAKIKALYSYVATRFRYISLDFGIGNYQPHFAEQTLANGYGDCKDKHTLLAAMLESVGIHAFPVLMNTDRQVNTSVPSPQEFDHVITAVPFGKQIIFLDTTTELAPYEMLNLRLRNKQGLMITGLSASRFVRTPQDPPFLARELFTIDGKVDDSGAMDAEVTWFFHGDSELTFKWWLREAAPSHYQAMLQQFSRRFGFAGEVSNVKVEGLNETNAGLRVSYHYHRPQYFDLSQDPPKKRLPLAYYGLPAMDPKESSVRLYFSPGELLYKCRLELPAGVTAEAPSPVRLERDYLHYESFYKLAGSVITGEKRLTVLQPEVDDSHRQDYDAFLRSLKADESQQVALHLPPGFAAKSNSHTAITTDALMSRAEIEYGDANYHDALADYRQVAERDPKHKKVWKQIGMIEIFQHSYDNAVKHLEKAVAIEPLDVQAHTELGWMYLNANKDDQGTSELKKALEIDPLSHRAHYLLGWYYAERKKDYPSAVTELEKALATDEPRFNDADGIRDTLTTAYFKANQPGKGVELLKRKVEASPSATTLNDAAYTLADNGQNLDLARQYARAALKALYAELRDIQVNNFRRADLAKVDLLASSWDTLGWAYFKSGDPAAAEKYLRAAWILDDSPTVGEHLGEVQESLGNLQEASLCYARSTHEFTPSGVPVREPSNSDPSRDRLVKLLGKQRAESLIQQHNSDSYRQRTFHLGKAAGPDSQGEFYFVFGPGPTLEGIRVARGDQSLVAALQRVSPKIVNQVLLPDSGDYKVVRKGLVLCSRSPQGCSLVLYTSNAAAQ